jgi:hypothetical protein
VSARPRRLRAAVGPRRRRRLRHTKSERPLPSITAFGYRPANACYLERTGHSLRKRPQTAMGRYCEFELSRSGHRRDVNRPSRVLRPQYLVHRSFEPPPVSGPNDCLVPVSVSTPASGQCQLTLHQRHAPGQPGFQTRGAARVLSPPSRACPRNAPGRSAHNPSAR